MNITIFLVSFDNRSDVVPKFVQSLMLVMDRERLFEIGWEVINSGHVSGKKITDRSRTWWFTCPRWQLQADTSNVRGHNEKLFILFPEAVRILLNLNFGRSVRQQAMEMSLPVVTRHSPGAQKYKWAFIFHHYFVPRNMLCAPKIRIRSNQ